MKWIPSLILSLLIVSFARAAGPDDQYLAIYSLIQQAETFSASGDTKSAIAKYSLAQGDLKQLQTVYPAWNPDIVKFRLEYVADKIAEALKKLPPITAATTTNAPAAKTAADLQHQVDDLAGQVSTLAAEKAILERKLKEALSVQPAPADTNQLAKAQQQIIALEKERDLLNITLAQSRVAQTNSPAPAVVPAVAAVPAPAPAPAPVPAPAPAPATADLKSLQKQLDQANKAKTDLERQCGDLKVKLAAKDAKRTKDQVERDNDQLRAHIAALEASAIPYTAEEQALLKTQSPAYHVTVETPTAPKKGIHSVKDLPAGAGSMMAEAQRSYNSGDFDAAEKKYIEVLRQDPKNVYVLSHLASTQFTEKHFNDCETNVQAALAVDPDDAASLYLLGNLRLQQDKVDDALTALTHSAAVNATNANVQNSLGMAFSRKGMDKAAETALRKALTFDPLLPEAHYNLAVTYAAQKPPSLELARYHYKKALDLGQAKNPSLEKLLESNPDQAPAVPAQ